MASEPLDISQLDLSDPETRTYVQGQIDLSDPDTKKWWDSTAPASDVPLIGQENLPPSVQAPKQSVFDRRLQEAQGARPGLDPENEFGGPRFFENGLPNPLSTVRDIADLAARGFEYAGAAGNTALEYVDKAAEASGLADALSMGGNKFLPGSAIGALGEAFPMGGIETGIVPRVNVRANGGGRLVPEVEGQLDALWESGTPEQIMQFADQHKLGLDPEAVTSFIAERDAGRPVSTKTVYGKQLEQEAQAFQDRPQVEPTDFEREAAEFQGTRDPTPEDLFPADKGQNTVKVYRSGDGGRGGWYTTSEAYAKQLASRDNTSLWEAEVSRDHPLFRDAEELDPSLKLTYQTDFTPDELSNIKKVSSTNEADHVNFVVDEVNKIAKDWKNSPEFEVVNTLDDIEDEIVRASVKGEDGVIGFVGEDGKVRIVASEVRTPEDIAAVTFHEALGHRGLQQRYQEGLDGLLETLYDGSDGGFKRQVDEWIARNPNEYADDINPLARAAEEVLAEMSESGQISPTVLQRIRNYLKQFGRDMGINLKYSDDEIRTILGLSHKAITDGEGVPVGSALRFKTRQQQINEAREQLSSVKKAGDFKTLRPFEDSEPDYWRFRYRDKNGELLSGNYTVNEQTGNIENFSIYGTTGGLGPKGLRDLVKKFKENHPEATSLEGYRMTGARKASGKVGGETPGEHLSVPLNRFMKRRAGSGSEGPLQGPGSKEEKAPPSTISKYRSNRNIEDIMDEAAPEKTRQSWEEWIDGADKTKMTGKIAASLARGTEAPELIAAQEFAVKSANRIYDLSRKIAEGKATEREMYLLGAEQKRLEDVSSAITDVVANAARLLNSRKIEIGSDKALSDGIRRMLANADLETPEGIQAAAEKIVKDQRKARRISKTLEVLGNVLNLPRSIMSSFDLSAPFRQGIFLVGRKELWKNLPSMFRQFGSEKAFKGAMDEIKSRENYGLMKRSGLALSDLGADLTAREEQFISQWAEKIPVLGRGIRASERGYTGFLNKLRADTFDSLVTLSKDAGIDFTKDPKALKDISSFVNNASGRGSLGKFTQAGPILNGLFFSPRLMTSRVAMLNPAYYVQLSPVVRKEAIKSLLAFGTIATTIASLFAAGGADVETDPRSSDFAKVKTGDTRYDILGGFGQYIVLGARLATNEKKDMKGDIVELGKKFGSDTRLDVTEKFLENKFSPVASFVADYLRGKDPVGEPFEVQSAVAKRFIPLFVQDAAETMADKGPEGTLMAAPGLFGVGTQTFPGPKGFDIYGRSYETDRTVDDPTISEIKRLQEDREETVLGPPGRSLTVDGERRKLTDEEFNAYQELSAKWIMEDLASDMNTVEWQDASDEEKVEWIREVSREARKEAREELFATEEQEPEETTTPWGEFE